MYNQQERGGVILEHILANTMYIYGGLLKRFADEGNKGNNPYK